MSRGLGKIERAVLQVMEKASAADDLILTTRDLYFGVWTTDPWNQPRAKYNALTRALRSLARKKSIRGGRVGRQYVWATTENALEVLEMVPHLQEVGSLMGNTPSQAPDNT